MIQKKTPELKQTLKTFIKGFRQRLANENALLPLSLLGILTGLLSGVVIQAFRLLIEIPGALFLDGSHEAFELLSPNVRLALPIYGALSLGLFLQFIIKRVPSMGISHVIQRLDQHHGRLPLRPIILQFLLGAWCVLTGQSAGREGPAVHLGAGISSYIGQLWKLPNNSIRVLVGCGTAAAIAASFNTPIAGVIFAMEVVMMEYTIAGFIPIMLSASAGAIISQMVYGSAPAFIPPILETHSLLEIPIYTILGIGIGATAALFCFIHQQSLRLYKLALWLRLTLAGCITGAIAYFIPQIMGIGYDTLDMALEAQLSLYLLLAVGFAKLFATAISSGLGMPIGVIGPTLLAGGCLGGATGILINSLAPNAIANDSLYILLGMGAMMGAVMNAPLAALIALLELTNTPDIILPGMIAIVVSTLINTQIFKQQSPHLATLNTGGNPTQLSAFDLTLQRIGVTSLMSSNVQTVARIIDKPKLIEIIASKPQWLIIEENNQLPILMHGIDLEKGVTEYDESEVLARGEDIDILAIPGEHIKVSILHFQASAFEAWQLMDQDKVDVLFVTGTFDAYAPAISGIITKQDIENYYHRPRRY